MMGEMKMRATNVFFMVALVGWGFSGAAQGDEPASQSVDPASVRAAAYTYFMRPPGVDKDYDTWADAAGPDIGEVELDAGRLPSRVDNSARPEFPPVYRQKFGACGQFTAVASMFTYEMNVLNGTKADADERRFPATFSWNMMNRAENRGSEAYHGWEVAKHVGIPTLKRYGKVEDPTLGKWPSGYDVWREAMDYRVSGYRYTPAQSVEQLNEARGWMFDRNQPGNEKPGGLLALDGRMGELEKVTRKIPEGEHRAGEDVWIKWGPTGYGHGITCAGYDDNIGYDVNGDGQITNDLDITGDGQVTLADWERGAYIVVNSWGNKWSSDGKIYLLYSAMIDPTWKRGNYLGRVEVERHVPRMTLRLKLSCDKRADLRMTVGLSSDAGATKPEQTIAPQAFNGWPIFGNSGPGAVPLAGPGDDAPLEVGIDLTPLLEQLGRDDFESGRVFLNLSRKDGSKMAGELHEAAARFYDEQGDFIREQSIEIESGSFGDTELAMRANVELVEQP